jgi:hypothetical protein
MRQMDAVLFTEKVRFAIIWAKSTDMVNLTIKESV